MTAARELVFAITSVDASTKACADHGDAETVSVLTRYYALAPGEVIKAMGDALLIAFPPSHAREAVAALRDFQQRANELWRSFDQRCAVRVKVGAGSVIKGSFGPHGQPDMYGDALNRLFKMPGGDFVIAPEVEAMLAR